MTADSEIKIEVAGQALTGPAAQQLAGLVVTRSVESGARTVLRFVDPNHALFDDRFVAVGKPVRVTVGRREPIFTGTVTGISVEHDREQPVPMLQVEARDDASLLASSSTYHAYLERTIADVVGDVAGRHGLGTDVTDGSKKEPYLIQTGTDHAFLSELAARLGYEWFVRDSTLVFRPRPTSASPVATLDLADGSLDRFSASYEHDGHAQPVDVHGWDVEQQESFIESADVTGQPASLATGSDARFAAEEREGSIELRGGRARLRIATASPRDAQEAGELAQVISRELVGAGERYEGVARCNGAIDAGQVVAIKGVGQRLSGNYYVTEVEHHLDDEGLRTSFRSSGATAPAPISPVAASTREGEAWGRVGFVVGVVSNVGDPDSAGRVKVMYPMLGRDVESDWARLVLPGAGEERGLDWRPEVGDEVVVGFDQGDPRRPFVLGGVWSKKYSPAEPSVVEDGAVARRTFTSRNGHRLIFSDGKGGRSDPAEQFVEVALADEKTRVHISEDGITVEAPAGKPIALKAGNSSLTFTDQGDLVIKAKSLDVEVDTKAQIRGAEFRAAAQTTAVVAGQVSAELSGAQVNVKADGPASVRGAIVNIN